MKIIRTKTKALGGITPDERVKLAAVAREWIDIAMRTAPIDPDKIIPAIKRLYAVAGLKEPRVVIVPSPLAMAFAYGASAAIWHSRRGGNTGSPRVSPHDATDLATRDAVSEATSEATDIPAYLATSGALNLATDSATHMATYLATSGGVDMTIISAIDIATGVVTSVDTSVVPSAATRDERIEVDAAMACRKMAGNFGIECARCWVSVYQGGNMWASLPSYISGLRDVLGLDLPEFEAYQAWEDCARHGGFRVLHEEFCIVSDFPERIFVDEQNRSHSEVGPSHRWRDGWSLYHWHGVRVPSHWIEDRANLDPVEVLKSDNMEQRAAGMQIVGWPKAEKVLKSRVIHDSGAPDMGQLIEMNLPGIERPGRFLKATCPRNGEIFAGVPHQSDIDNMPIETAQAAQAYLAGKSQQDYQHPPRRT